jgi:hypothetical protein
MGTFKIKAIAEDSESAPNGLTWRFKQGATLNTDVVAGINSDALVNGALFGGTAIGGEDSAGDWAIRFNNIGASIQLDGVGSLIGFNDLPPGFRATSGQLSLLITTGATGHTSNRFLQLDVFTEQAFPDSSSVTSTLAYDFAPLIKPTMLDIVNNGFGIRYTNSLSNNFLEFIGALASGGYPMTGTYDIVSYDFSTSPTEIRSGGTTVATVTATQGLDEVDELQVVYDDGSGTLTTISIPAASFLTQTATEITFTFPDIPAFDGDVALLGVGDGVQFSGSVMLGSFTVVIADASGIYRLDNTAHNDTLYISASVGPETEVVAIPTPFFSTGYIGG